MSIKLFATFAVYQLFFLLAFPRIKALEGLTENPQQAEIDSSAPIQPNSAIIDRHQPTVGRSTMSEAIQSSSIGVRRAHSDPGVRPRTHSNFIARPQPVFLRPDDNGTRTGDVRRLRSDSHAHPPRRRNSRGNILTAISENDPMGVNPISIVGHPTSNVGPMNPNIPGEQQFYGPMSPIRTNRSPHLPPSQHSPPPPFLPSSRRSSPLPPLTRPLSFSPSPRSTVPSGMFQPRSHQSNTPPRSNEQFNFLGGTNSFMYDISSPYPKEATPRSVHRSLDSSSSSRGIIDEVPLNPLPMAERAPSPMPQSAPNTFAGQTPDSVEDPDDDGKWSLFECFRKNC